MSFEARIILSSHIESILASDEKVICYSKPHYAIFFKGIVWFLLLWISFELGEMMGFNFFFFKGIIRFLLFIIGILEFFRSILMYYSSEYIITSRRVLMKTGFFERRSLEILIDRIEGIYVEQSILGKILNFGVVIIIGIGGTRNSFNYVAAPLAFRSCLDRHLKSDSVI